MARSSDGTTSYGHTALVGAIIGGHEAAALRLIAAGVSPDRLARATGELPLTAAAKRGRSTVIRALLAAGARPDENDAAGNHSDRTDRTAQGPARCVRRAARRARRRARPRIEPLPARARHGDAGVGGGTAANTGRVGKLPSTPARWASTSAIRGA